MVCLLVIGRDIYLFCGNLVVRRYHRRPLDVVYTGKAATGAAYDWLLVHVAGHAGG